MDQLIRDVLALSRISSQEMRMETVDLDRQVRQVIQERPELQAPQAQVCIEGSLPAVRGHEASLTQCLANLLGNAVKFVAPGVIPQVRLFAEANGDRIRLWVADNGIGIAAEAHEKIFEIFQRLHARRNTRARASGWPSSSALWNGWAAKWEWNPSPGKGAGFGWNCARWRRAKAKGSRSLRQAGDDFGRAVSRILSAPNPCGGENHLSQQPVPGTRSALRNMERAAPESPIWPCTRWGFPCLRACAWSGGLLPHLFTLTPASLPKPWRSVFCGTVRRDASRRRLPRVSCRRPSCVGPGGYAASRPVVFGLSSSPGLLRGKRFSALPKSMYEYTWR